MSPQRFSRNPSRSAPYLGFPHFEVYRQACVDADEDPLDGDLPGATPTPSLPSPVESLAHPSASANVCGMADLCMVRVDFTGRNKRPEFIPLQPSSLPRVLEGTPGLGVTLFNLTCSSPYMNKTQRPEWKEGGGRVAMEGCVGSCRQASSGRELGLIPFPGGGGNHMAAGVGGLGPGYLASHPSPPF